MQTKAELTAWHKELETKYWVTDLALKYVLDGERPLVERARGIDGDRYKFSLYAADHAHGGIVIMELKVPTQRAPYRQVHYFEALLSDWHANLGIYGSITPEMVEALEKLNRAARAKNAA